VNARAAEIILFAMPHPIPLQGFDHIVLRIHDKPRMIGFYTDVLGCSLEWDRPELGLTHLRAGRDLIDLVTLEGPLGKVGGRGPDVEGRNLDHFCLRVAPFDEAAIRRHLAACDVEIVDAGQRFGASGEGPSLYVRDPEGNTVELKGQPID
jgi:catechol 2,3-dioxygenase-like lactoylglutathione lyase family enzyme